MTFGWSGGWLEAGWWGWDGANKIWPTIPIKWQSRLWFICSRRVLGVLGNSPNTAALKWPQMPSLGFGPHPNRHPPMEAGKCHTYMEHNKWAGKTLERNGRTPLSCVLCQVKCKWPTNLPGHIAAICVEGNRNRIEPRGPEANRIYGLFICISIYILYDRRAWAFWPQISTQFMLVCGRKRRHRGSHCRIIYFIVRRFKLFFFIIFYVARRLKNNKIWRAGIRGRGPNRDRKQLPKAFGNQRQMFVLFAQIIYTKSKHQPSHHPYAALSASHMAHRPYAPCSWTAMSALTVQFISGPSARNLPY